MRLLNDCLSCVACFVLTTAFPKTPPRDGSGSAAVGYLVVCGSWIGYTTYIWLLEHVPTSKVSTYAYVNPVVAVFLGWLVLHEKVDRFILAGSAIVVVSVILVTSAKVKEKVVSEQLPAVEAAGD